MIDKAYKKIIELHKSGFPNITKEENQYGEIVNKPFWTQGSKMLAITSGIGLFVGGITVTLSGN